MNAAQTIMKRVCVSAAATLIAGSFALGVHAQGTGSHAPVKSAKKTVAKPDPLRTLFLTPGGRYTKADIKANGRKTVAQKYPGFMAEHDTMPKPGERICPITNTKANPKLTWVLGGKAYQFCCPPCVAEFVKKAKTDPKAIRDPSAYVKKS